MARGLDALPTLLDAWRRTRAPVVGDAIDVLDSGARRRDGPVPGATRVARSAAWAAIEAGGASVDLGRLLEALPTFVLAEALAKLETLRRWLPDPRASTALLRLVERPPRGFEGLGSIPFWREVLARIEEIADPRAVRELERIDAADDGGGPPVSAFLRGKLRPLAARIASGDVGTPSDAELALAGDVLLDAASGAAPPSLDALYTRVYEHPDDEAARLVLADALAERGDPRGELIALQCALAAGNASRKARVRVASLLRDHGRAWLGRLDPFVGKTGLGFERGFVSTARALTEYTKAKAAIGLPEWATVRELDVTGWGGSHAELVGHPVMRSLRVVRGGSGQLLGIPLPRALEELTLWRYGSRSDIARLAAVDLPRLRRVELLQRDLTPADLEPLWPSNATKDLRAFAVWRSGDVTEWSASRFHADVAGWISWATSLPPPLERFELRIDAPRRLLEIDLVRGHDGRLSALHVREPPSLSIVEPLLEALAPDTIVQVDAELPAHREPAVTNVARLADRIRATLSISFRAGR